MDVFCVTYRYADLDLRAQHRDAHIARLNQLAAAGQLIVAGPRHDSSGAMMVLFASSVDAVEKLMRADVYSEHGVLADLSIQHFRVAVVSPALPTAD